MPLEESSPTRLSRRTRSFASRIAMGALGLLGTLGVGAIPAGASQALVHFTVVVNGQPAATSSDAHPAQINPKQPTEMRIRVSASDSIVHVSTVRFEGAVMDLPLFSYNSTVDLTVPAHSTRSVSFPVSVTGIGNNATGLVMATVTLLSPSGRNLSSQTVVTKIAGSISSLYGLFGLAVLVLTVSSLFFALLAMARRQLPENRWLRAIRFLVPGFGVGLVLIFTMSVLGVFDPGTNHWLALLIIPSMVGLAFGYLTPAPEEEEFDDYDPNVLMAQIMIVDDDPLEVQPALAGVSVPSDVVRPTSVTMSPSGGRLSGPAPDNRATTGPAPDPRATTGPNEDADHEATR